jgi:uncharacterized membrane protein (DUF2068 family)
MGSGARPVQSSYVARGSVGATSRRGPIGFRIIGAFKLVGSILLLGAGVGVYHLAGHDVGGALEEIAATCRLDPRNHFIHAAISWASGIDPTRLRAIGVGTFFYAALYLAEGIGLVLGKTWGGYLTSIATGSLIPLEVWEVARHPEPKRITVLLVNLAVLVYVVWKLVQERRAAKREDISAAATPA